MGAELLRESYLIFDIVCFLRCLPQQYSRKEFLMDYNAMAVLSFFQKSLIIRRLLYVVDDT
jgi:hypothetical protein